MSKSIRERVLTYRPEYNLSTVRRKTIKQTSLERGPHIVKLKTGDLVHISQGGMLCFTTTVSMVTRNYVILSWYDEYKYGIPISYLQSLGHAMGCRRVWDYADGLYDLIKHKGTRFGVEQD